MYPRGLNQGLDSLNIMKICIGHNQQFSNP